MDAQLSLFRHNIVSQKHIKNRWINPLYYDRSPSSHTFIVHHYRPRNYRLFTKYDQFQPEHYLKKSINMLGTSFHCPKSSEEGQENMVLVHKDHIMHLHNEFQNFCLIRDQFMQQFNTIVKPIQHARLQSFHDLFHETIAEEMEGGYRCTRCRYIANSKKGLALHSRKCSRVEVSPDETFQVPEENQEESTEIQVLPVDSVDILSDPLPETIDSQEVSQSSTINDTITLRKTNKQSSKK